MENINTQTKEQLIQEITTLIDNSLNKVEINIKYIEYFELDELIEIKDSLVHTKNNREEETSNYLDDIFSKCS